MQPKNGAKVPQKPAVHSNKSKINTKSKEEKFANRRALGLNSGIIVSNMTALIASGVPVAGLQQVAQAVAVVFTIAEVCR